MKPVLDYLILVGDAFSQLLNVMLLMGKNPNESISGRAWRMHDKSKVWNIVYLTINALFFLEDNHCKSAYLADFDRAKKLVEGI